MALPASTTKEGYEIQFGTNHVGHFLFTKLLMPTLQRTAEGKGDVRIVNLSSEGHRLPPRGGLALRDAHSDMASYNTWVRYGQSKLANILFTRELTRRYPAFKSIALHPGGIDTGLKLGFQKAHPLLAGFLNPIAGLFLTTVQQGVLTQLFGTSYRSLAFPLQIPCSTIASSVRVLLCRVVAACVKAMLTLKSFQPRRTKRPRPECTMSLLLKRALGQSTRKTPSWRENCGSGPNNNWPSVGIERFEW